MVRGIMTQHVMEAVSQEMFGGAAGPAAGRADAAADLDVADDGRRIRSALLRRHADVGAEVLRRSRPASRRPRAAPRGITMPYTVHEEAMTAGDERRLQRLRALVRRHGHSVPAVRDDDMGVEMLLERQRGLWKRLRSAPVSRRSLLAGKAVSGA